MATKAKNTKSPKKSFFAKLNPSSPKKRFLLVIAIFAVVGGGYAVARSFAATIPSYYSGYIDLSSAGAAKYSPSVISTDGTLCVSSTIDTYNVPFISGNYFWEVQVKGFSSWNKVATSGWMSANGNLDHHCYGAAIIKGYTYRVKFQTGSYQSHGTVWVRGYYKSF